MVYTLFNLDKEPKTIIEVGTHYGTEAIALKRKYPKSRVITYEADTEKCFSPQIQNYENQMDLLGIPKSGRVKREQPTRR